MTVLFPFLLFLFCCFFFIFIDVWCIVCKLQTFFYDALFLFLF